MLTYIMHTPTYACTYTQALARQPWFVPGQRCRLRPEVADLLRMYFFWAVVWAAKMGFAACASTAAVVRVSAARAHPREPCAQPCALPSILSMST